MKMLSFMPLYCDWFFFFHDLLQLEEGDLDVRFCFFLLFFVKITRFYFVWLWKFEFICNEMCWLRIFHFWFAVFVVDETVGEFVLLLEAWMGTNGLTKSNWFDFIWMPKLHLDLQLRLKKKRGIYISYDFLRWDYWERQLCILRN